MANLLTLDIIDGYTRPVVLLKEDITCLIDSGADVPVWTRGSDKLLSSYQAKQIQGKKFLLSGFGKEAEIVNVYSISDLEIKGEESADRIIFKNLTVACTERPFMVANLIMPATAFSHMNYTVKNIEVDNPVVEIYHKKIEYSVSPIYSSADNRIVERVYSFTNE